jgi:hypothetical protein
MSVILTISFLLGLSLFIWASIISRKARKLYPKMSSTEIWKLYFENLDKDLNAILKSAIQKIMLGFLQFFATTLFVLIYNMLTGNFKW